MLGVVIWLIVTIIALYFLIRKTIESLPVGGLSEKPVLITGCDSGFGYELALKCVINGIPVFAGVLTEEGKTKLIREANAISPQHGLLKAFIVDVRCKESVESARMFVEENLSPYNGLHAVVNNAGIVGNAAWDDWLTPEDYEEVWRVNTLGVIRITHAFKDLVKKSKGRIISTASVCGRVGIPGVGPYNVSKFGVEAYCDTIRVEMRQFGVKVVILEPGFFKTPLTSAQRNSEMIQRVWDRAPQRVKDEYGPKMLEFTKRKVDQRLSENCSPHAEWVVEAYFHAITSIMPRLRYQIGYDANLFFIPLSMLPTQIQEWFFWGLGKLENPPKPRAVSLN
ncbi:short chain dehydrogenase domain-containing protein [Ditylenchus destructor]|uniref:Short chain dehydrogenase domain-containing protein n=1 Tax=Ditylenchus destructor TaxID=166010 RepID=A0AAD4MVY5_9BILA|nr:short chain dehydrogenase domain-containing protein [Ditylenchus destructor]